MTKEEYFNYLKLCAEITDKLDNTAEYESWLLVQDYADYEHRELIRLNTIINELERHLEQQYLEWKDDSNDEICAMADEDKCILEKLRELKGDSSNV